MPLKFLAEVNGCGKVMILNILSKWSGTLLPPQAIREVVLNPAVCDVFKVYKEYLVKLRTTLLKLYPLRNRRGVVIVFCFALLCHH